MRIDRRFVRSLSILMLVVGVAALAAACSSSPTSPALSEFRMASAQMLLQGAVINGTTMAVGHGSGSPVRFEATLIGPDGPAAGQSVRVRYRRPGGMMGGSGEFQLYDDGTHGDEHAGDGIYCFEDVQFEYGCTASGMGPGSYHYEFFGLDHQGHHSNHLEVSVTLE